MTGMGMLGLDSLEEVLAERPATMASVSPERWNELAGAYAEGWLAESFEAAWSNGRAFLHAVEGLRGRRPVLVEWKGSHRAPGDEVAPIDLRVDHVFLISCKYASKIMINASPFHLFERMLQGGHGTRAGDWYEEVAPVEYQQLYDAARLELGAGELPRSPGELRGEHRRLLASALASWPASTAEIRHAFVRRVSAETTERWQARCSSPAACEPLLWRMLRMGSAPYFLLGAAPSRPLRLRIATPWDWRLQFRLRRFEVAAGKGGQPSVDWKATVEHRHSGESHIVAGHVEVRWSHGRFGGHPEAKVYLDTPHELVPGYFNLV